MADDPAQPAKRARPAKPAAKKATKPVAKKPAAKKPAAKKPAAKKPAKAPAKATAPRIAAPLVARRPPRAEVIGDAEERHPDDPVLAAPEPPGPGLVDELVDGLLGDAEVHERSPLLVRVVRGAWLPACAAALPAVLVTVVAVVAGTVGLLFAERPGGDEPLVDDLTFGRWVRVVLVGVGMAFGSPFAAVTRGEESSQSTTVTVVPLTVTLLALAALWIAVRRFVAADRDPLPAAVRTAVVFAGGIAALAAFGRWKTPGEVEGFFAESEIGVTTNSVAPLKAMFWAFLAALAVAYVARRPVRIPLAVRGALAGLGAGIAASFVTMVALAYAYAGRVDAAPSDVTTALPTAIGYGIDLGTAGLAVAMGGEVHTGFGTVTISLWESWVPGGYVVLFAIPVLAVAAGVAYIVRYGGVGPAEAARACGHMAVPAALIWVVLAVVGAASYQLGFFFFVGNLRLGAVLWAALLVLVWFGVLGWLGGHLVLRRANLSAATDRRSLPSGAAEGPDPSGDPRR